MVSVSGDGGWLKREGESFTFFSWKAGLIREGAYLGEEASWRIYSILLSI